MNTQKAGPLTRGVYYIAPVLLLCASLGLLYWEGLVWLVRVWEGNAYSHGYVIPLISLYLLWIQRARYQQLPNSPAYGDAAVVIIASWLLLLVARCSAFIQLEAASLFLIIPGIVLLLFGRRIMRAALLPWLYLSFMMPWFDLFLERLQLPLQRLTAVMSGKLLGLFYPVFLSDVFISLPSITMEVAKECSGSNFFISVLAIGVPLVYLSQRSLGRALVVLGLGMGITVLANALRVTMAGIMGENFGADLLHGPAHILQGWFVAWVGWIGVFIVNWLVGKHLPADSPRLCDRWQASAHQEKEKLPAREFLPSAKRIFFISILLCCCAAALYFLSPKPAPLSTSLADFPGQLSDWRGSAEATLNLSSMFPGADEQLQRVYRSNATSDRLLLYIAYFEKQTEKKRLVSQFSRPLHKKARKISLEKDFSTSDVPVELNRSTMVRNGKRYDIFFWYQFPDIPAITNRNQARWIAFKNGVLTRNNSGAVVVVAVPKEEADPPGGRDTNISLPVAVFIRACGISLDKLLHSTPEKSGFSYITNKMH